MIAAYIGSAAVSAGVSFVETQGAKRRGFIISWSVFLVPCALFTIWFINTGGEYEIYG